MSSFRAKGLSQISYENLTPVRGRNVRNMAGVWPTGSAAVCREQNLPISFFYTCPLENLKQIGRIMYRVL